MDLNRIAVFARVVEAGSFTAAAAALGVRKSYCILYRAAGVTAVWRLSGPRGEEEVSVRGRVETDEFAFVRASAREGVGIAFIPIGMVASLVESGELKRVLPRYALRGSPVHIVWPSRGFEPAAVRLLRDALVEALAPTLA